jgi:hypothetical protein
MTPDEILDAVSKVEAAGASVQLSDGRPKLFGNVDAVPDDARRMLRGGRPSWSPTSRPRPAPPPPWSCLSRSGSTSSSCRPVSSRAWRCSGGAIGRCYRLTPAVLVWVEVQAERHKDKPAVAALAAEFGQWVSAYYPPHQIRAARIRRSPLPDVKPPPTCPGADEWAKVLPQYQQKGPE